MESDHWTSFSGQQGLTLTHIKGQYLDPKHTNVNGKADQGFKDEPGVRLVFREWMEKKNY